jgi:hypothetical protein
MTRRFPVVWLPIVFLLAAGCSRFASTLPEATATIVPTTTEASLPEVVLIYTMDGGIAGFCERMEVYAGGEVLASSCKNSQDTSGQLDETQLSRLLEWTRTYGNFQYERQDDAVSDNMIVAVQLSGVGQESSTPEIQQAVLDFAAEVWAQLASAGQVETPIPEGPTPAPEDGGEPETILILSPGPGSRLTSPLVVSGMADSTFEQALVVRLLSIDGETLAQVPTAIQAELGQGGPFEVELSFDIRGEAPGFIQVFSASPRDGGTIHLATIGVTLAKEGPVDLRPTGSQVERIQIASPGPADPISGGMAHVEGIALPSFEGTLVVEVLDVDGTVIGSLPIIVNAPDIGQFGSFAADVPYTLSAAGPGRIVVRDPSPAFPGDIHLASVEVQLAP